MPKWRIFIVGTGPLADAKTRAANLLSDLKAAGHADVDGTFQQEPSQEKL